MSYHERDLGPIQMYGLNTKEKLEMELRELCLDDPVIQDALLDIDCIIEDLNTVDSDD